MSDHRHENLISCLKAVWWREQLLHAIAGILALCRWIVPLFLIGMTIDWLADLSWPGRVLILATVLTVSGFKAWRIGWRHSGSFNATRMALKVEQHHGGLESLLVTAVQFGDPGSDGGVSDSLRAVTRQRAEETAGRLRAGEIVVFQGLRRPAVPVVVLALLMGVFAVVSGPFLIAGATRIFAPWSSVSYPTRTHLQLASGDLVVKEGDRAQIGALVSGVIPKKAKLVLRTGTGTSRQHELAITDGRCDYTMESVFRGFEYRIIAGDARSPWHTVRVISPPRIEQVEVRLDFPAYTERPAETGEALTVVVPENTGIQWRLTLDRAVRKAEFVTGDDDAQPLEVSADGRVVTMRRIATESRAYSFAWVEREHGFAFTSPRYYVQVAPDQRPSVELTSPRADLYATLGRKLELAYRGRDDYGIGESAVSFRVNKTGEVKVPFTVPTVHDGSEQRVDWDYRTALPELAVGDSVTFAIELADRYPGPAGPQRVRSDARRVLFLSKEQYLEQVARQKQRLLSQLQSVYREERAVHDLVRRLDPLGDAFVQTCQLEAVRQDLVRERLGLLATEMRVLIDDLAANNITEEAHTQVLDRLSSAIQAIADEHVGGAASSLRSLASVSGTGPTRAVPDPAPAVLKVNTAARELGLLVLELGYKDAAEVIARELHATAQTQATLRLKSLLPGSAPSDTTDAVSEAQEQLMQSLTRLLAAAPREQESTMSDALVAFGLSRLSKQLLGAGVETKMRQSAALIRSGESADAARLQAEVIHALLRAEFRLRFGSEYEALYKARDVFASQAQRTAALRDQIAATTADEFRNLQPAMARAQAGIQKDLHLLLMPAIPAPRPRLFDERPPPAPSVGDLLVAAESATRKAAAHINASDRDAAVIEQQQAHATFNALAEIAQERVETLTQLERAASLLDLYATSATRLNQFKERQLGLLERTEDAASDRIDSTPLSGPQQKLLDDLMMLQTEVVERTVELGVRPEEISPLHGCIERNVRAMADAEASLRQNQPAQAGGRQRAVLATLKDADRLLTDDAARVASFVKVIGDTEGAMLPGPYVADIEAEQRDLIAATREARPDDMPGLVMPQKNLVHAVNAVLAALDVLAHKVDSGTEMLFAKTDMDSAAAALETGDVDEAIDAQTAVADSVHDLNVRLQAVTPQYGYILELTEFMHDILPEAASLHAAQSQLRAGVLAVEDATAVRQLASEQRALESRAKTLGGLLYRATGQARYQVGAATMGEALARIEAGDAATAAPLMQKAEESLAADRAELLLLMKHLAIVLDPPPPIYKPTPQLTLLLDVLPLAAQQKELWLQTQSTAPAQLQSPATKQQEIVKQLEALVQNAEPHPKLVEARQHLSSAAAKLAAGVHAESVASQQQAGEVLRHFIVEYVTKYVVPVAPGGPQPPAPSDEVVAEADISIFMPGVVSGKMPRTGRMEWEVLGRRERAALNENFARELPLEYRAILKDYYERLTR